MSFDRATRTAFRLAVAGRDAPRALAVAAGAFIVITLANALVGPPMAAAVFAVNAIVGLLLVAGALLVRVPTLSPPAVPWILAMAGLALVVVGLVQVWISPDPTSFVYILLIMIVCPLVTLAWRPSITTAIPMLVGGTLLASERFPEQAGDWVVAIAATIAVGMALLWLRLRSVDELGEKSALIGALATRDRLTEALNRHGVEDRVPELVGMAVRHHESVFAVFADVDGLKAVNDAHGHHVGDSVLVATADALRGSVRAGDLVSRWGGDEFVILGLGQLADLDHLEDRVADRLRANAFDPAVWAGRVSIGFAVADAAGVDVEDLICRADADMYARRRARRTAHVDVPPS